MAWFNRAKGSRVENNAISLAMVGTNASSGQVGPGGGYNFGGGPRAFVGSSRGPDPVTELGRPGDFPEGQHTEGDPDDDGFPYSTRWKGYPPRSAGWEPPFFDNGNARSVPGQPWGGGFMGGNLLTGRVSTVFACVDLISRSMATMPLQVTQDTVIANPAAWIDNPEPQLYTSRVDAIHCLTNTLLLRGDGMVAATARYEDGTVARWAVLNPDMVNVETDGGGLPIYDIGGVPVPRADILHMKYQMWPGAIRGVGPLDACYRNLVSADALERWGTELATTHGIPTAVLQSQAKLTKGQTTAVRDSWAEALASRGILPAVLSGGLTYTPLNLRPADIGLLDLRMFDEQRIASAFGCPLWLVGLPMADGLTYSTVQGTFDYLWRATLRPLACNIACGLAGWALTRSQHLRFASEGLVEPPVEARAQMYETFIRSGVMSVDEVRVLEHLPPRQIPVEVPPYLATGDVPTFRGEGV